MDNGKAELISWSAAFSVGINLIDDQHKELFKLVNDMFNHVVKDAQAERAYFKKVIERAVEYVKVHFYTEEKIMLYNHFPGYSEHKKAHDTFVLTVVDKVQNFEAGKKFILLEFTQFLKEWILTHIAIMDKGYFSYFSQTAARKPDGTLDIDWTNVLSER